MSNNEKALIGSIQKFSTEDGPGVRSTVFIKGCPLRCSWCHNPEMIDPRQQIIVSPNKCIGCGACLEACPHKIIKMGDKGPEIDFDSCDLCEACIKECYAGAIKPVAIEMSVEEVLEEVLQDKTFYDNTGGGVTISGGEALMHADFAGRFIEECAKAGINVCIDTSGYSNYETLERLAKYSNVEYLLYDMKHIDDKEHLKYTGVGNSLIIDNLRRLARDKELASKLWLRMPLIAGINDSDDVIDRTVDLYKELGIQRVSLMGYHDYGNSKAEHIGERMKKYQAPTDERLKEIKKKLTEVGIEVEITGLDEALM